MIQSQGSRSSAHQSALVVVGRQVGTAAIVAWSMVLAAGTLGAPALAQAADPVKPQTDKGLLEDFVHYTKIADYQLARGKGGELVGRQLKPTDMVKLADSIRGGYEGFDEAVAIALKRPDLEPVAASLMRNYRAGKIEMARDPNEIKASIALLLTTERGRMIGTDRLRAAGEYAMPQLVENLLGTKDMRLRAAVQQVITGMGPHAVAPLVAALLETDSDPVVQERIALVLGDLGYPGGGAALADVKERVSAKSVKEACERALRKLNVSAEATPAMLYTVQAERYYNESPDTTMFPGEDFQLLWSFDPRTGLIPTAIRTPVFHEAMSMANAARSLKLASENAEATALWVAANLKRELESPEGYANPAYSAERPSAMYFAVAAGPEIEQRVLGRAMDSHNTALARKAIEALSKTAGGKALWATDLTRQPLLEALRYPSRRVRYDAALALGAAQPNEAFDGAEQVVGILAGSIRESTDRYAAIVASGTEVYQTVRGTLEKAGYKVLPMGRTVGDLDASVNSVSEVEVLVVAGLERERVTASIDEARQGHGRLAATPTLVLSSSEIVNDLRKQYAGDVAVEIRSTGVGEGAIVKTIQSLVDTASGGAISADEATSYSKRSLSVLRDLAIGGGKVFKIEDAAARLIDALESGAAGMRLEVAEVLAHIDQAQTQAALAEAVGKASGAERVELMGKLASAARRYGNKLEQRHIESIRRMAKSNDKDEATAAAALLGSLNLKNSQIVPLMLGTK